MCGRYTVTTDIGALIVDRFGLPGATVLATETLGRFNVCPTEPIAVVDSSQARAVRWGLGGRAPVINVRSETAATRFGHLFPRAERRCLVVADGWYEWLRPERRGGERVPFRYTVDGGELFAFAGLCDGRRAAILTTEANPVCAPVHDRMPCVLGGPEEEAAWLSGEPDAAALGELLAPLDPARCGAAPASPAVNRAGVEGPELLVAPPRADAEPQLRLAL